MDRAYLALEERPTTLLERLTEAQDWQGTMVTQVVEVM